MSGFGWLLILLALSVAALIAALKRKKKLNSLPYADVCENNELRTYCISTKPLSNVGPLGDEDLSGRLTTILKTRERHPIGAALRVSRNNPAPNTKMGRAQVSRLTDNQHQLAVPLPCPLPAPDQHRDLL